MSFLKIRDPAKRNQMVEEYLELKKNIRGNLLSERTGEQHLKTDLSKFYRPITETQKDTAREIREGLGKPIKKGIENLPSSIHPIKNLLENITLPTMQPFWGEEVIPVEEKEEEKEEKEQKEDEEEEKSIGEIAEKYLKTPLKDRDTTFGIITKKKKKIKIKKGEKEEEHHCIGKTHFIIKDNNIIRADVGVTLKGTPGIWELLMKIRPTNYTREDFDNYAILMISTNVLHHNDDPNNTSPRSSGGDKWVAILSPIWEKYKKARWGKGIVVIPSDPNALLERLDLLLASQEAGHTGVGNELVSI